MKVDEFYLEKTKIALGFLLVVLACGLVVGKLFLFEKTKSGTYPRATSEQVVASLYAGEAYCEDIVPMELLATDFAKPQH